MEPNDNKEIFLKRTSKLMYDLGENDDREVAYTKSSVHFLLQLLSDRNIDAMMAINKILFDAAAASINKTQSTLVIEFIRQKMLKEAHVTPYKNDLDDGEYMEVDKELMDMIFADQLLDAEEAVKKIRKVNINTIEDILGEAGDMEV